MDPKKRERERERISSILCRYEIDSDTVNGRGEGKGCCGNSSNSSGGGISSSSSSIAPPSSACCLGAGTSVAPSVDPAIAA